MSADFFYLFPAVDLIFDLLKGHAVFFGDVGGIADALRRRHADLEAAFSVVHTRNKAFYTAVTLHRGVYLADRGRKLVHMCIKDCADAEVTHGFYYALRYKHTLGNAGRGKALVEQQQTVSRRRFENI